MSEGQKKAPKKRTPTDVATAKGWTSSEFWATLSTSVGSLLAMAFILFNVDPGEQGDITAAVTKIIGALGTAVVNGAVIWKYIESRRSLKEAVVIAEAQKAVALLEQVPPPEVPAPAPWGTPEAQFMVTPETPRPDPYGREGDDGP